MVKRLFALTLCLLLTLALCACGGGPSAIVIPSQSGLTGSLRVYYMSSASSYSPMPYDALIAAFKKNAPDLDVQATAFDDAAVMRTQLQTDLENDTLPDVILCSSAADRTDLKRLAASGKLLDLLPYLQADETFDAASYYAEVFAAGQVGEQQFALPFTFTVPVYATSEQAALARGLTLEEGYTAQELYGQLQEHCGGYEQNGAPFLLEVPLSVSTCLPILQEAGMTLLDPTGQELVVPEADQIEPLILYATAFRQELQDLLDNLPANLSPRASGVELYKYGQSSRRCSGCPLRFRPSRW